MRFLKQLFHSFVQNQFLVGSMFILFTVFVLVTAANFSPGTLFSGWDVLHPEFNFSLSLSRALTGVWQEHEGLGHIGGHGYNATLPHTILVWLLSFVFPIISLRSLFILLTYITGGIGIFMLISFILKNLPQKIRLSSALIGSLYYLFNFGTVQQFYLPLEAFTVQFATLPFLLLLVFQLLDGWKPWVFFLFLLVSFISSIQGFIPPLFVVLFLFICVISLVHMIQNRSWVSILTSAFILLSTLFINAYWLLPVIHSSLTDAAVLTSNNNILSTQSWIDTNTKYGNLQDLLMLRGFPSQAKDELSPDTQRLLFAEWIAHMNKPEVKASAYILFSIIIFGFFAFLLDKRKTPHISLCIVVFLLFALLATQIPFLSTISSYLQTIPLVRQAFRTGFTKVVFPLAMGYSIFLAYGISKILHLHFHARARYITAAFFVLMIIFLGFPILTGNLLYKKARLHFPDAYTKVFTFFSSQPKKDRVMTLPQGDHWGWDTYRWGYVGSGFLWFGIPQPVLERAFDVWSRSSENYYWELIYALYSQNQLLLEQIVTKYNIDWIVFDISIITYTHPKQTFYTDKIETLLDTSSKFSLVTTIPIQNPQQDTISIYKVNRMDTNAQRVRLQPISIIDANPYEWNNFDSLYQQYGDYSSEISAITDNTTSVFYPFRTLFTSRPISETFDAISETDTTLVFSSNISSPFPISELQTNDTIVPDTIPFIVSMADSQKITVEVPKLNREDSYDSQHIPAIEPEIKQCSQENQGYANFFSETSVNLGIVYQLENEDTSTCFDLYHPQLDQKNGYLVSLETRTISGEPLTASIINSTSGRTEMTRILPNSQTFQKTYLIIPPMESDGIGYSIRLSNTSIGKKRTINQIGPISIYPIPYATLMTLHGTNTSILQSQFTQQHYDLSVEHPNPAYYKIKIMENGEWKMENTALILSQSYDEGWRAYTIQNAECRMQNFFCRIQNWLSLTFPFLFGKELKDHVLVNNWENAWVIQMGNGEWKMENNGNIIILFFLPQLLEWIGFALLPLPFLFLFFQSFEK